MTRDEAFKRLRDNNVGNGSFDDGLIDGLVVLGLLRLDEETPAEPKDETEPDWEKIAWDLANTPGEHPLVDGIAIALKGAYNLRKRSGR